MAKITFTENPPIGGVFDGELSLKVDSDGERAVYTDQTTGSKIIVFGDNLKESAMTEGFFATGKIDKLIFKNPDGDVMIDVTDGKYKASDFNAGVAESGGSGLYSSLFDGDDRIEGGSYSEPLDGEKGDDRIIGGLGMDTIFGGKGDDVLTGGKDSDAFVFDLSDGVGQDRITDLDITGDVMDKLYIWAEIDEIGKTDAGKDTLITFENGATLELDGIRKADFLDWFTTPSAD